MSLSSLEYPASIYSSITTQTPSTSFPRIIQMPKGKLFEFAVLYHPKPTKDQNDRGESPKSIIIVDLTSIVTVDEKQITITASRSIPQDHAGHLDDIEILVLPL